MCVYMYACIFSVFKYLCMGMVFILPLFSSNKLIPQLNTNLFVCLSINHFFFCYFPYFPCLYAFYLLVLFLSFDFVWSIFVSCCIQCLFSTVHQLYSMSFYIICSFCVHLIEVFAVPSHFLFIFFLIHFFQFIFFHFFYCLDRRKGRIF